MVSPVEVMSATFAGLHLVEEERVRHRRRGSGASRNDETIQFTASSTSSIQPKRSQTGRFFGGVPVPPPGAPSTRQGFGSSGPVARDGVGVVMARKYPAPAAGVSAP